MTVAFSGNVTNDFPGTTGLNAKYLTGGPVTQPLIPPDLENLVTKTGFDLEGAALTYDPVKDELFVGILQPDNGQTGQRLIAGDFDNNLNSATLKDTVEAVTGKNGDTADLGFTEGMAVFFDLNNDGTPDIIAGIQDANPDGNKNFQVARAVVTPFNPRPAFGVEFPANAGNFYLVNSPFHPAMEFSIKGFSGLYKTLMGTDLPKNQTMTAGVFGQPSAATLTSGSIYFPQQFNMQDVSPTADLAISKIDSPDPVRVGDKLVYTLIVNNLGPFENDNVIVKDYIPSGVNVVSITPSQGMPAELKDYGFEASLGKIAAGGSASITVVAQPTVLGPIRNTATVSSGNAWIRDPNPANDTAFADTQVLGPMVCPPILVNPHEAGVINTGHDTIIRVNVYGTSQLDATSIEPNTVTLAGATPIGSFTRYLNGDRLPDRTFLFLGSDPAFDSLPKGYATVTLSGQTTDGSTFDAAANVFNVDSGCFGQVRARDIKHFAGDLVNEIRAVNPPLRLVDVIDLSRIPAKGPFRAHAMDQIHARSGQYGQALGSSTVRIPGVRSSRAHQIQVVNPVATDPVASVELGSSTVRIPFASGKTGPVVIDNASQVGAGTTRRVIAKATPTVKIAKGMTRQAGVGAKLASSINDFTLSY